MTRFTLATAFTPSTRRAGTGFWAGLAWIMAVLRQRKALARLDESLLRDIGLTRSQAREEANRSALDLPDIPTR